MGEDRHHFVMVTRQSLRFNCKTRGCPWPKDEAMHVPWCLGIPDVEHWADKPTHQHWPKKGMGGNNPKSKIVAILCPTCHDRIDNGDWGNNVNLFVGAGGAGYRAWDVHGNTLIERPVLSAAAEERGRGSDSVELSIPKTESLAAAPSAELKEESDERANRLHDQGSPLSGRPDGQDGEPKGERHVEGDSQLAGEERRSVSLTHEQRVAIAQQIHDIEWNRQWTAGDVGNVWIAELGEEAEQYLSDFGYVQESLANILRVCAAIPKKLRRRDLRFSHHVVVAKLNREDMEMWLDKCVEEQWSVAEFRRQVKGGRPRVKRYSPGEIHDLADEYPFEPARNEIRDFADWLGQRDGNDGLAD